jgi:hypothetical protein
MRFVTTPPRHSPGHREYRAAFAERCHRAMLHEGKCGFVLQTRGCLAHCAGGWFAILLDEFFAGRAAAAFSRRRARPEAGETLLRRRSSYNCVTEWQSSGRIPR